MQRPNLIVRQSPSLAHVMNRLEHVMNHLEHVTIQIRRVTEYMVQDIRPKLVIVV